MSRFHVLLASVVVGAAAILLAGQDTSTAAALFQQGLLLERAEGDVAQAVVIYERVIAEHPTDTQVTCPVLSHLAEIYDRRHDPRAMRLWTRSPRKLAPRRWCQGARTARGD